MHDLPTINLISSAFQVPSPDQQKLSITLCLLQVTTRFFLHNPNHSSLETLISFLNLIQPEEGRTFHYRLCKFIMSCSVGAMEKSGANTQHEIRRSLDFPETELKLGLPGVSADELRESQRICGKRSFSEAMDSRNYTIPIPNEDITKTGAHEDADEFNGSKIKEKQMANDPARMVPGPPPKAQVVGWPPVRDFRKVRTIAPSKSLYVKVSMDGAPYLRKVDLKMYSSYHDLSSALQKMFSCLITMGKSGSHELNESNSTDVLNGSEYVPTYEDKDADWMLVGDVPWQMFVDSCQRMRIMKASEAIGLAPRAVEKCKNRIRINA